jgi:hypothetical protein
MIPMTSIPKFPVFTSAVLLAALTANAAGQLTVTAVNHLDFARPAQTLELSAQQLAPLGEPDLEKIHVRDAGGRELICQAVDTDYDPYHKPDEVIFQADFGPGETKNFTVVTGKKQAYTKDDFKAYGRFVRERFDDFAWENDRIAHRTYGKALETWKGEPLTSSAIDIWSKRTRRLVINDWYMLGDAYYHHDRGEGCDDYSAGATCGDGGNGLWADDKLWRAKNFVNSRVLANGPIRVLFELDYDAFDVAGKQVSEVLRVSLDAGSQLDHYEVFYKPENGATLTPAVGIKKAKGEQKEFDAANAALIIWEPMAGKLGMQGLAALVDPKMFLRQADDKANHLLLLKTPADNSISYWAGFAWDRAGDITTPAAWKKYVTEFAQGVRSPIAVAVSAE